MDMVSSLIVVGFIRVSLHFPHYNVERKPNLTLLSLLSRYSSPIVTIVARLCWLISKSNQVLTLKDAVRLIAQRGRLIAEKCEVEAAGGGSGVPNRHLWQFPHRWFNADQLFKGSVFLRKLCDG